MWKVSRCWGRMHSGSLNKIIVDQRASEDNNGHNVEGKGRVCSSDLHRIHLIKSLLTLNATRRIDLHFYRTPPSEETYVAMRGS